MKKNVLAEQVLDPMDTRLLERGPDPAIFRRVQMTAYGEKIAVIEKLPEIVMTLFKTMRPAVLANNAAHRLYRKQAVNLAAQQSLVRDIGGVLRLPVREAEQLVEIAITLLVLRHQHQRILQDQR